jgi:hypothetical protein
VELVSGPVLSRVDLGCQIGTNIQFVTVCQGSPGCRKQSTVQPWSVSLQYVDGNESHVQAWSNISACANNSTAQPWRTEWNTVWDNMSILNPNVTTQQLSFPATSMDAWLCGSVDGGSEPMNESSSQGWLFYQQATNWLTGSTPFVNAVTNCNGPEGVYGTNAVGYDGVVDGVGALIEKDMVNQCTQHH